MKAKKIIIPVVCVAVVGAIGIGIASAAGSAAAAGANIDASFVEKQDTLMKYISVLGTVESQNCSKVYSTLSYPVEKINCEVGDLVRKGDVLCTLNTDNLQNQILQQQASVDSSNVSTQYQLTAAEKNYSDALSEYNSGNNQGIKAAEQNLSQAESALAKAQSDYDNAVEMSGKDKNTQLRSAELALKNAKDDLETAEKNYTKAKKEKDEEDYYSIKDLKKAFDDAGKVLSTPISLDKDAKEAYNKYAKAKSEYETYLENPIFMPYDKTIEYYQSEYKSAEDKWRSYEDKYKLENARKSYDEAKAAYENAKKDIDRNHNNAVEAAENALAAAKKSVESAEVQIQSIKDNTNDGIRAYKSALSSAQLTYENAKENLSLAKKAAEANLSTLKSAAERERTVSGLNDSGLIALESLKEQLDEAVIKAPSDGMVTFIGASEGGEVPRGTLFTIEDKDNLKITASLREYDVAYVETGMKVIIKSSALSDAEYEGIVTKIAPTAEKAADGSDAKTALFAIEVAVISKETQLKIGMTAKMQIVIEEKNDVLTVPEDCLAMDDNGNDIIYVAEKGEKGYTAKKMPVTVGLETDFYAEISGEGIKEKLIVITSSEELKDGQAVTIDEEELGIAPEDPKASESERKK